MLANDQLTIRLGLDPLTRTTIERTTGRLSRALVVSALLVGGGNVVNAVLRRRGRAGAASRQTAEGWWSHL
jgi:hypothetical protein